MSANPVTTTPKTRKKKPAPDSARALVPTALRDGLSRLALDHGLPFDVAVFAVLVKLGDNQASAYARVRPGGRQDTAATMGSRWMRRYASALNGISIDDALAGLADWTAARAMTAPEADWRARLAAADQVNRRLGRYRDDSAGTTMAAQVQVLVQGAQDARYAPLEEAE